MLFSGDPYGNRTHVFAVRGRCLSRLTNGPCHQRMILYHKAYRLSREKFVIFIFFVFAQKGGENQRKIRDKREYLYSRNITRTICSAKIIGIHTLKSKCLVLCRKPYIPISIRGEAPRMERIKKLRSRIRHRFFLALYLSMPHRINTHMFISIRYAIITAAKV